MKIRENFGVILGEILGDFLDFAEILREFWGLFVAILRKFGGLLREFLAISWGICGDFGENSEGILWEF